MGEKHNDITNTVIRIIRILKESNCRIKKTYLYGSYAKGKYHKDSDIDILCMFTYA